MRVAKPLAAGVGVLTLLAGSQAAASASASGGSVRVGGAPRHPGGSEVIGTLPGDRRLTIAIVFEPRDPAGLAVYATAVANPGSRVYHRYLTVAQFRQRFSPKDRQIAAVADELRSKGLQPGHVSTNGLSIPVSATAAAVARAFAVSFDQVRLPGGRVAFANTRGPQFPASVASEIQAVIGLSTLARARPLGIQAVRSGSGRRQLVPRVVTGGPQPCSGAISFASKVGAYTADQLASAYRFSSLYGVGDEGAGQIVAFFELEPFSDSDIQSYQSCYGTNATVSSVPVSGGAGSGAGSGEAALDIEDVIGLAPSAAIRVYEGPNTNAGVYETYSKIISDDVAKVISTSWGLCEAQEDSSAVSAENTLFQEAATQGQSIFAAAGDSGSQDCTNGSRPLPGLAVDDPASQPYVTGVGGTSMSAIGPPPMQSVWNDGIIGGAGGGGVSAFWKMPSYQSGAASSLNVINSNSSGVPCTAGSGNYCREVPDVSADADEHTGYVIYYNGSWTAFGGTSAAAPLWAAFTALANASSTCNGTPIGFANPVVYSVAGSRYSSDFSDITSGNNNLSGSGLYPSGTAYDMASGLGTPIGSTLPAALCGGGGNDVTVTNPGNQTSPIGSAASLQISASDSGGSALTYIASRLPSGLTINELTGLISGNPTALGAYGVTVIATKTGASNSASFTWTITKRSTSTSVNCVPSSVATGAGTMCTATVTDTASSPTSPPSGTVNFSPSGSCTLAGSDGTATCHTTYTPSAMGTQSVTASYEGDSTHSSSSSSVFSLTVMPVAPRDQIPPAIIGTLEAGQTLFCSTGTWTGSPTGYSFQWRRNGSPTTGAMSQTYTLQTADSGATLTCTVTAANMWGAGQPATSSGVHIAGMTSSRCPAATGKLSGSSLGLIRLGMTRKQARAAYARRRMSGSRYQDLFCLTPAGIRAGYPSGALLRALTPQQRKQSAGRVIWATTANRRYSVGRVRAGTALAKAGRLISHATRFTEGRATWYFLQRASATIVLKVQRGVVTEVGIASKRLTQEPRLERILLLGISLSRRASPPRIGRASGSDNDMIRS